MKIRSFTTAGIEKMELLLDTVNEPGFDESRAALLEDDAVTTLLQGDITFTCDILSSRLEAARYIDKAVEELPTEYVMRNSGLWSWLALLAFPLICPKDKSGRWKPGARARWVLDATEYRRY